MSNALIASLMSDDGMTLNAESSYQSP